MKCLLRHLAGLCWIRDCSQVQLIPLNSLFVSFNCCTVFWHSRVKVLWADCVTRCCTMIGLHQSRSAGILAPSHARYGCSTLPLLICKSSKRLHMCRVADSESTAVEGPSDSIGAKAQDASNAPVARIVARRSVVYEDAGMHRPLGLVLFGAYVLGSASSLAGKQPFIVQPTLSTLETPDGFVACISNAGLLGRTCPALTGLVSILILSVSQLLLARAFCTLAAPASCVLVPACLHLQPTDRVAAGIGEPLWLPTLTGAAIGLVTAIAHRYCNARLWRPPTSPLNVLITGGTKGLGKVSSCQRSDAYAQLRLIWHSRSACCLVAGQSIRPCNQLAFLRAIGL